MDGKIINEQNETNEVFKKARQAAVIGIEFIIDKLHNIDSLTSTESVILWTEKLGKMIDSLQSIDTAINGKSSKNNTKIRGGIVPSRYENPNINFS